MNEFLIDIPVKINIWTRKDCFRKQFDVIKEAKPSILFVQSDGGRNSQEWEIINLNRKIVEKEIDWNCRVYKIYSNHNCGLYASGKKTSELIWNTVDRCVFLEDDDIPSISFFAFCKEMLDKYENDYRILGICGFNPLNVCKDVSSDYFFTAMSNPWGTATWRRSKDIYLDNELSYYSDKYVLKLMKKQLNKCNYKMALECAKKGKYSGHVPGIEFYYGISRITQNVLFIFPKYNLISNHGCSLDSEHSNSYKVLTKQEKKLFYSKTYDLSFPLIHPRYVISDVIFQKKVRSLLGNYNPFKKTYRRIIKGFKMVFIFGPRKLMQKISKISSQKKKEN